MPYKRRLSFEKAETGAPNLGEGKRPLPVRRHEKLVLEQSTGSTWDVAPDGKRFLIELRQDPQAASQKVVAVTNWFDELRRKAPRDK